MNNYEIKDLWWIFWFLISFITLYYNIYNSQKQNNKNNINYLYDKLLKAIDYYNKDKLLESKYSQDNNLSHDINDSYCTSNHKCSISNESMHKINYIITLFSMISKEISNNRYSNYHKNIKNLVYNLWKIYILKWLNNDLDNIWKNWCNSGCECYHWYEEDICQNIISINHTLSN